MHQFFTQLFLLTVVKSTGPRMGIVNQVLSAFMCSNEGFDITLLVHDVSADFNYT